MQSDHSPYSNSDFSRKKMSHFCNINSDHAGIFITPEKKNQRWYSTRSISLAWKKGRLSCSIYAMIKSYADLALISTKT